MNLHIEEKVFCTLCTACTGSGLGEGVRVGLGDGVMVGRGEGVGVAVGRIRGVTVAKFDTGPAPYLSSFCLPISLNLSSVSCEGGGGRPAAIICLVKKAQTKLAIEIVTTCFFIFLYCILYQITI